MADVAGHAEPPTIYANVVTLSVDPDAMYMELRQFIVSHREHHRRTKAGGEAAPFTDEMVYTQEPIARIVITYTAAKALQTNLADLIPKMQAARREPAEK